MMEHRVINRFKENESENRSDKGAIKFTKKNCIV